MKTPIHSNTNEFRLRVFHSFVVAASASLLCVESIVLSGISVQYAFAYLPAFLFLIFCATLFSYSVGFIFPHPINSFKVLYQNKFIFVISIADVAAVVIFLIRHFHDILNVEFVLVSAVILVLSYYYLKQDDEKLLNPHSNVLLKNLSLVTVWGLTTVSLPLLLIHKNAFDKLDFSLLVQRMLFVYALVIPFEIRDVQLDMKLRNKNIVHLLGDTNSKILAFVLLVAFCLLAYYDSSWNRNFIVMVTSAFISFLLIIFYKKNSRYHNEQLVFIDGMMMMQALFVIGVNF